MNRESSKMGALSSSEAELCVLRGGAFTSKALQCRSALRFLGVPSSERSANIGFRPVAALPAADVSKARGGASVSLTALIEEAKKENEQRRSKGIDQRK